MKFIKNLSIASYVNLASAILILASMILTIISSSFLGYEISQLGLIIGFSIVAAICLLGSIALSLKFGNHFVSYIPMLVAAVLSGVCFYFVINSRTYLIGTVWATSLDRTNEYAVGAMGTGGPAFIIYCATMIVIAAGSFFNLTKEVKVESAEVIAEQSKIIKRRHPCGAFSF